VLINNKLEFTNKWARGKGIVNGNHKFEMQCKEDSIEHRLTATYTLKTNGMVVKLMKLLKMRQSKQKSKKYYNIVIG
jgi:hypothetical protein